MIALLLCFLLALQDRPPEKCSVTGTVVNSLTGQPLNKVDLVLEPLGAASGSVASTTSNSQGDFALADIAAGQYRLKGRRNGYLDTYFGGRRPGSGGIALTLAPGQILYGLRRGLLTSGVISGTTRVSDVEPLTGAAVRILRLAYAAGGPSVKNMGRTTTDDLGQ
ncbi:MAG: carboxypeptidase regulatory-like domain-containing protein [bacterium]|nr:carboxypeptidase regulatory-like domain-containing protein [bacterium]